MTAITRPFLTAAWRHLVMITFEIDPALVQSLVPAGVGLDRHADRCLASLVGFRFLDVRLRGRRVPFHTDFDEVNLRFYVRRRIGGECRRAVVFVRELVPKPAVAIVARWVYGERYSAMSMRHLVSSRQVMYEWRLAGRWGRARLRSRFPAPKRSSSPSTTGGYARHRRGTVEYEVEHPRWPVKRAHILGLACDAERPYGPGFARVLERPPTSAFVADGSAIAVGPRRRLAI